MSHKNLGGQTAFVDGKIDAVPQGFSVGFPACYYIAAQFF
jgi:hypothetical protein